MLLQAAAKTAMAVRTPRKMIERMVILFVMWV